MAKSFKEALKERRSIYELSRRSTLDDQQLKELLQFAVKHVPSAYNSQSTRLVLLTGKAHEKLWDIVKDTLQKIVPEDAFARTRDKIDVSFASGYGTVLFFEDEEVVENQQKKFPTYADNFPIWSQHTSAMHQLVIWTMLEDAGMGASLQHYNPLIDKTVTEHWHLPEKWKLIAQMPFGKTVGEPAEKEFEPVEKRVLAFSE